MKGCWELIGRGAFDFSVSLPSAQSHHGDPRESGGTLHHSQQINERPAEPMSRHSVYPYQSLQIHGHRDVLPAGAALTHFQYLSRQRGNMHGTNPQRTKGINSVECKLFGETGASTAIEDFLWWHVLIIDGCREAGPNQDPSAAALGERS